MRIAILSEVYPTNDQPNRRAFVHARAKAYQRSGHEVQVFTEGDSGGADEAFEGVPIRCGTGGELQASMLQFGPDVIAFHTPYAGTASFEVANQLAGEYPVVVWIHGYEAMYTAFQGYHQGWQRWASVPWDMRKLWRLRQFLPSCAAVVYVSQWLRALAERNLRYRYPTTHVIHNPVDTQRFAPLQGNSEENREVVRGVALRSLGRKYGLDIAVQAFAGITHTDLAIVGTGPLEAELRRQIKQTRSNTQLITQGFPHDQVPALLRQYDYFVAPSRNETQGLAMCEAMSCRLPVVASHVGGIPEFVRDGVDGYLVPPEDPPALRRAVLRLTEDLERCRQMGKNAREHMLEICDSRHTIAQELEVFQAVRSMQRQVA